MNEPTTTVVGNLAADPELRFTPSGHAVVNVTIASTPRTFDKATSEWRDGETWFVRGSAWREMAENVAESLKKGDRVVAAGRLVSRSWDDEETGQKRSVVELAIDAIGPDLWRATARPSKASRTSAPAGFGQSAPQADPWATQQPATTEAPF